MIALLAKPLFSLYEEREACRIVEIILEDVFLRTKPTYSQPFSEAEAAVWKVILARLENNEPLQYVTGFADFYGLKFKVNPHVLIPRAETEELVFWILKDYKKAENLRVLDLGTGSGCIPISLKKQEPTWEMHAIDIQKSILELAAENAKMNKTAVHFHLFDILNEIISPIDTLFDIIVSNPPYILPDDKNAMRRNVLDFEPHLALFVPADDPLIFYRHIAEFAQKNLKKNGCLYFEIHADLGESTQILLLKYFKNVTLEKDMSGRDRMIKCSDFKA